MSNTRDAAVAASTPAALPDAQVGRDDVNGFDVAYKSTRFGVRGRIAVICVTLLILALMLKDVLIQVS